MNNINNQEVMAKAKSKEEVFMEYLKKINDLKTVGLKRGQSLEMMYQTSMLGAAYHVYMMGVEDGSRSENKNVATKDLEALKDEYFNRDTEDIKSWSDFDELKEIIEKYKSGKISDEELDENIINYSYEAECRAIEWTFLKCFTNMLLNCSGNVEVRFV